jgi:uncharacterized iron-regulated protein
MPRHPSRRLATLAALALLPACSVAAPSGGPAPGAPPYRIYTSAGRPLAGVGELVDSLASVDFVFFGEQHDDAEAHRLEEALLEELARRGRPVVVAMEMFERDVQPELDSYLARRREEAGLVEATRAWPNYPTDYRPLVEIARREHWPVIASNAPRRFATAISLAGIGALSILDPGNRPLVAAEVQCPRDEYYHLFVEALQDHPAGEGAVDPEREATLARYYEAQCLKDETMAESIARARPAGALLVHFNGAFHTDRRLGIVPRLERRLPGARIAVLSAIPARDPRQKPEDGGVADYMVMTRELSPLRPRRAGKREGEHAPLTGKLGPGAAAGGLDGLAD